MCASKLWTKCSLHDKVPFWCAAVALYVSYLRLYTTLSGISQQDYCWFTNFSCVQSCRFIRVQILSKGNNFSEVINISRTVASLWQHGQRKKRLKFIAVIQFIVFVPCMCHIYRVDTTFISDIQLYVRNLQCNPFILVIHLLLNFHIFAHVTVKINFDEEFWVTA